MFFLIHIAFSLLDTDNHVRTRDKHITLYPISLHDTPYRRPACVESDDDLLCIYIYTLRSLSNTFKIFRAFLFISNETLLLCPCNNKINIQNEEKFNINRDKNFYFV